MKNLLNIKNGLIDDNTLLSDVLHIENLEDEVWKDVYRFDGLFSISNFGRVKREARVTDHGRQLKQKILSRIYCKNLSSGKNIAIVHLNYNSKRVTKTVSSLVVESFIRPLNKKECAIHINKNRLFDDSLSNLKIGNYSESIKDDFIQFTKRPLLGSKGITGRNKIIEQLDSNGDFIAEYNSLGEVERKTGFKKSGISAACNGKYPDHYLIYGFKWKFKQR